MLLLLIYLNVRHRLHQIMLEQKLFLALIQVNALLLVFDTLMWVMDGKTGFGVRESYLIVTAGYYILNPVICLVWYFYVDYLIYKSKRHLHKILIPILIPALLSAVLSLLSLSYPLYFTLDAQNVYHRGPLFIVMALSSYFYLVYTLAVVLRSRKAIRKQAYLSLLLFVIPPFVGGILQTLFYGLSVVWVFSTISILLIFINIQNDQLYTDYLTGLFNRRQLDAYLQQQAQSSTVGLSGIMLDLNSFKLINDTFGHTFGDLALRNLSEILQKSFGKGDFIARYGGDEFVIITAPCERRDLAAAVARLNRAIEDFNLQKILPFPLSVSVGYDSVAGGSGLDADEFLRRIDFLMYEDKKLQVYAE